MTPRPRTGRGRPRVVGGAGAGRSVAGAHQAIDAARRAGEPTDPTGVPTPTDPNPAVPGPAGRIALRPPSDRHQLNRVSPKSPPKAENTIILPEVRDAVRQDIADIQAGRVRWDPGTNSYVTDGGRRYKVEPSGTVFPVDGPGFVRLDRSEYKALQALIRHNGDLAAARASVARDPSIPPGAFERADAVYAHYRK
ncbi:hypothetical protein [Saccharothrix syringae]|uniref:Uncharacterized protein n=1 Tax=Saccharothrix syringae TaxID=103733 RepID=A0A5Q0H4G9_SACSY|nr:hypothetical protein [Saccharothrix syringae]QFZ21029.1 hypothetical protein EKG83_29865 [Saccharothrix syringae]